MTTPGQVIRWQFISGAETYTFERNPRTMQPIVRPHSTSGGVASAVDGRYRGDRAPARPFDWSFQGRITTQTFYDALLYWAAKPEKITLRDHFERQHTIRLVAFEPEALPTRIDNDWRFEYTMRALVYVV